MAGKRISELVEVLNVDVEQDYIAIQRGTDNKKLKLANMMGSTNVGEDFVDLLGEDGIEYRLLIDSAGKVQVFPKDCVVGHVYKPGDNLQLPLKSDKIVVGAMAGTSAVGTAKANVTTADGHGIVINQAYGGGSNAITDTATPCAVSHSFVELYNCSNDHTVNLCGLYLHYKGASDAVWKTLALRGSLPPRHSFLIRGKQHGDLANDMVILKLYDYDQEWIDDETKKPIALNDGGMSLYLSTSATAPTGNPTTFTDTVNESGAVTNTTINQEYVDLLGVGAAGTDAAPPAYNKFFHNCMNKDTAIRRIDFRNNKNNKYDSEPINYRKSKVDDKRPRSLRDGRWEQDVDKIKLNNTAPNLVNITFGKQSTTRLFTWQSVVTDAGVVKYRRIKDESGSAVNEPWKEKETEREIVCNHGSFATIHRVKIDNLAAGIYEYKCGEPGHWSDIETLAVKAYDDNSNIRILLTTDQQGFTEPEYEAWNTCVQAMRKQENFYDANGLPNFDFHVNCGDISQNASNLFEWLYYSKYAGEFMRNIPHMTTCGNNDLVNKNFGFAFNHYATYEGAPKFSELGGATATKDAEMVSTYSFDIGFVHFICLNSNEEQMYNEYGIDKTQFLDKQARFLDKDLWEVSQRPTKPRWVIVYAHLGPFSVTRAPRLQHWVPILEHYGVDLFLFGHNHSYCRSIPIKCGYKGSTKVADYNTYVPAKGSKNYTVVNELKANGSEIDRDPHPLNGTYYILCQASGSKTSGKETNIPLNTYTLVDSQGAPIADGPEKTKHFSKTLANRPWWYAADLLSKQPSFCTLSITKDAINFASNNIPKVVDTAKDTGVLIVKPYDSSIVPTKHDTLTINYSEREPEYRTGVTAPYYSENKTN